MKKKIANNSLGVLCVVVCFGLFQAWKESKNPFALFSSTTNWTNKSTLMSDKTDKFDTKDLYTIKRTINN